MAKIFISHSSKDKAIVDLCKNVILNAGLGISDNDIAYTSAPETGVPTGGNIPQYIKENIADCDFVFFMISDNYRESEVCLNEMGAAWALDKKVKPILLYDVSFNSVGWLYSKNLCAKIDDSERLDALRDEFLGRYTNIPQTSVWNRNKKEFISRLHNKKYSLRKETNVKIYNTAQSEQIGILDCIELFEQNRQEAVRIIKIIQAATDSLICELEMVFIGKGHFKDLLSSNSALLRRRVNEYAKCMDKISDVIETNGNLLKKIYSMLLKWLN